MLSVPEVPAASRMAMSEWGPRFRRQAAAATRRQLACGSIRVGTECSGSAAPVLSLRALGLTHEHLFSSEIKEKARRFIAMHFMPSAHASKRGGTSFISDDMLARVSSTLPFVEVYIVGFPCKPFSQLRSDRSGGFKEKAARPFIKLLNVLQETMPAAAILETIEGMWKALKKLKLYEILTVHVDPFCMGEPVQRPRIYFMLIRADVAVRDLDTKAASLVDAVGLHDRRATVAERIFAARDARTMAAATWSAPSTSTKAKKRPAAAGAAFASSQDRGLKWRQSHVQHAAAPSQLPGATERQRSLHGILRREASRKCKAVDLEEHAVDLSQSLGRTRRRLGE
jgi:site-specific DNA-cytosine methylase